MSRRVQRAEPDGNAINWRETTAGVEIYDEGNPDAWIHAEFTAGVAPERRLFSICPNCGSIDASRCKPGNATVCGDCGSVFDHFDR